MCTSDQCVYIRSLIIDLPHHIEKEKKKKTKTTTETTNSVHQSLPRSMITIIVPCTNKIYHGSGIFLHETLTSPHLHLCGLSAISLPRITCSRLYHENRNSRSKQNRSPVLAANQNQELSSTTTKSHPRRQSISLPAPPISSLV